ncbi:acyl-CoA dehydrogenase family protein [Elizabethkingia meningoseptica]|uniref:acyl-CoA dehydrogenase family protein n=1 Tax=Elizabethkingia meningoseptica TaxID=238 RepID=UPI000841A5B8|nr:acyl-CoA dehydrogenase family protein [Elizabethkingia meningoseptica]MDE5432531.1 acyl-CoA dehydrogenase family protein [Elizabethkingia meningoseptica]MDE5439612.1 acyl-CoA dehydrogenase family protein [Elizabethkingia meningoseptica]MDE5510281.1 acyl-CoA dehydrogenase family protein [Elizabethkingia meningoseptica]MDE5517430.1 acyl-CoA dehydrogenase family protein [Elizabethkingia meningoseptica]MDE5528045.1 acyl-CoA dehydrogenase family protein [Elizabethkingia meningoseptica]
MSNIFSNIKQAIALFKSVDLEKLSKISQKVDIPKLMDNFSKLDDKQIKGLMKMMDQDRPKKELPPVDGDFYDIYHTLTPEQREIQLKVRAFMEKEVKPIVNNYWLHDDFPFELIPKFKELNICGVTYEGYGCPGMPFLMEGVIAMEMARIDASIATFFGVQSGLAMGSIYICGSEEQKQKWLPQMQKFDKIGAFGLTEPEVGSGAAGGLTATCKKTPEGWILNGEKKWIGNATFADVIIIWARDLGDGEVKGFIVEKGNPGFSVEKIKGKMALRIVQNGLITLKDCLVTEENRLQNANSFKDTAKVLRMTRAGVAWMATGCARGAYESALSYTRERKQFGKPIASFQMIQGHLVEMLSNLTAMQTMVFRLSEMQDEGILKDEHASLAKVFCTLRTRDIVSRAREVMGGNGILLEYDVARFVADAEAIYSYEGTKEINSLIVGRSITGFSAFV